MRRSKPHSPRNPAPDNPPGSGRGQAAPVKPRTAVVVWSGFAGIMAGLFLLKFGNPVILNELVTPPASFEEWLIVAWPVQWGFFLILPLAATALFAVHFKDRALPPIGWLALPIVWLAWQGVSATRTVDGDLTRITLLHFSSATVLFYAGAFALRNSPNLAPFSLGMIAAFSYLLWRGLGQHFGELQATREFVMAQPEWTSFPPEYKKKIMSDRIFSTMVYPNAFAGAILMWTPVQLHWVWRWTARLGNIPRGVLTGSLGCAAVACLVWSGSKAGWLIAMLLLLATLTKLSVKAWIKAAVLTGLLTLGLTAFFVQYKDYFKRGATSVGARFDYWSAAWKTAVTHPVLGTGPGTFSIPYSQIKDPESEMARLAHNDYLEQASDSGWIGFAAYTALFPGVLAWLAVKRRIRTGTMFAVWIGLLGWTLHGAVEFSLYIPALAWPAFLLLGWLLGVGADSRRSVSAPI